jgi:hypothetical protein
LRIDKRSVLPSHLFNYLINLNCVAQLTQRLIIWESQSVLQIAVCA